MELLMSIKELKVLRRLKIYYLVADMGKDILNLAAIAVLWELI
jgi:hypothetical protein